MRNLLIIGSLLLSTTQVFAQSLSPNILPAGKSIVGLILDSTGKDVTSQYSLSYASTELKITPFAGKSILIGSISGNYNILATNIANQTTVNLPVTVTPGAAANVAILDGNNQSAVAGVAFTLPIRLKVTDTYGNIVPGTSVSFSNASGSAGISSPTVLTDSNGIAATNITAGSAAERESIAGGILVSGLSKALNFTETVTAPANLASKLVFTAQAGAAKVGTAFSFGVSAETATNVIASTFTGSVSLSAYSNSSCSTTSSIISPSSANAVNGVASFSSLQASAAGTVYLKASATGLTAACSQAMVISLPPVGGVASLKFIQLPTLLKTNQNLFPAIRVEELDSNGSLMSSATDSIIVKTFDDSSCLDSSAVQLSGGSSSAVSGYATLASMQSITARTVYFQAQSGSAVSACSAAQVIVAGSTATPTPSPTPTPTACNANQHVTNNACVSNTETCLGTNGTGSATWTGSAFGSCVLSGCNSGYDLVSGVCLASCSIGQTRNPNSGACYSNLSEAAKKITVNQNLSLTPTDGLAPFTYQVTSGTGSVSSAGLFTSATAENDVVQITDSTGSHISVTITVNPMDGTLDPTYGVNGISSVASSLPLYTDDSVVNGLGETFFIGPDSATDQGLAFEKIGADGKTITDSIVIPNLGYISNVKAVADANGDVYVAVAYENANTYNQYMSIYHVKRDTLQLDSSFSYSESQYFTIGGLILGTDGNLIFASNNYSAPSDVQKIDTTGNILFENQNVPVGGSASAIAINSTTVAIYGVVYNYYQGGNFPSIAELDQSTLNPVSTFGTSGGISWLDNNADASYGTIQLDEGGNVLVTIQDYLQYSNGDQSGYYEPVTVKEFDATGTELSDSPQSFEFGQSYQSLGTVSTADIGGKLLILAGFNNYEGNSVENPTLQRLDSSLNLDADFASSDFGTISANGNTIQAIKVQVLASGMIYVSGYYYDSNLGGNTAFVSRFFSSLSAGPSITNVPLSLTYGKSLTLSSVGGDGVYTYSIVSGSGSIDPSTGIFTSGNVSGPVVIQVTDSNGKIGTATLNVIKFSIASSSQNVPSGNTANISVIAGSATPPYTYSISQNNSGGSISASGVYTAGVTYGSKDIIQLTDSTGNTATTSITVIQALTISPTTLQIGSAQGGYFYVVGGTNSGYTYSLSINGGIGSSLDQYGDYQAGINSTNSPILEEITVTDSSGSVAKAEISVIVNSPLVISPTTLTIQSNNAQTFSASGGTNSGYTYSLSINGGIGSSIDQFGQYKAGISNSANPIQEEVTVTDLLGNVAKSEISVTRVPGLIISNNYASMTHNFWELSNPMFQSTGKLLIPEQLNSSADGYPMGILRYNQDGTVDESFGSKNIDGDNFADFGTMLSSAGLGTPSSYEGLNGTTVDSSDRVYVLTLVSGLGTMTSTNGFGNFTVMRLTKDGVLDSTFGSNGSTTFNVVSPIKISQGATGVGSCSHANIKFSANNLIVSAYCPIQTGSGTLYAYVSSRILVGGTVDTTYGTGGVSYVFNIGPADYNNSHSNTDTLADGSIIANGVVLNSSGSTTSSNVFLFHVSLNGTQDSSWGSKTVGNTSNSIAFSVVNNKVYVVSVNGSTGTVSSYNSDGTVNSGFSQINYLSLSTEGFYAGSGQQENFNFLGSDSFGNMYLTTNNGLISFNPSGVVDSSFSVPSGEYAGALMTLPNGTLSMAVFGNYWQQALAINQIVLITLTRSYSGN
jgi:hypothetical protein